MRMSRMFALLKDMISGPFIRPRVMKMDDYLSQHPVLKNVFERFKEKPLETITVQLSLMAFLFSVYSYRDDRRSEHKRATRQEVWQWREFQKTVSANALEGKFNKRDSLLLMCNFPAGVGKIHGVFLNRNVYEQTHDLVEMIKILIDDPNYTKDVFYRIRGMTHNTELLKKGILYHNYLLQRIALIITEEAEKGLSPEKAKEAPLDMGVENLACLVQQDVEFTKDLLRYYQGFTKFACIKDSFSEYAQIDTLIKNMVRLELKENVVRIVKNDLERESRQIVEYF